MGIRFLTLLSSVAAAQLSFAATINQFPTLPVENSSFAIDDLDGDGKFDIILISAVQVGPFLPVVCIDEMIESANRATVHPARSR